MTTCCPSWFRRSGQEGGREREKARKRKEKRRKKKKERKRKKKKERKERENEHIMVRAYISWYGRTTSWAPARRAGPRGCVLGEGRVCFANFFKK